ncbi:TetR/AcrR family transcriptional regulator [Cohaesibacter haloalkalitolerans]|uniref:TetR/AcrR family transcriptional regulator n=1 Tax=Cohaesibacter haloalkalitolerans TaxID=1162980 RepID=UPI000E64CC30|nr:TetR/AcrR family transcriptional regulator [Cohaesibacter haloalkalitolerans]
MSADTDTQAPAEPNDTRHSIGARKNPETEAAILDAAAEIIAEKGIGGLRMEAVARRAKAGKATLYRWWPTRGALLLAVYQRKKPHMTYRDTGSLYQDLLHFANDLITVWKGDNGLFFKAIIAEAESDPDVTDKLREYHAERLEALCAVTRRARDRGDIPADEDPTIRAEMLISLLWQRLINNRLDEKIDGHVRMLANSD